MVELDRASNWSAFGRLCPLSYDPRLGVHHASLLYSNRLAGLPPHSLRDDNPRLYLQHADPLDRTIQRLRLNDEHDLSIHRDHPHPGLSHRIRH